MTVKDCDGRLLYAGDRVGVAFSYSRASVGHIRIGTLVSLEPLLVTWEKDGKTSPPMVFASSRFVKL